MKRLLFVLLLLAVAPLVLLAQQTSVSVSQSDLSGIWFVELSSPPTADGAALATVRKEKDAFRLAARQAGINFREKYAFDVLFNGLSLEVNSAEASKLSLIDGVKAVYPVERISVPATRVVADPELVTALAMTGADIAQNELGYTGAGIKVAVMDTGIDYQHPDLGGCFGMGCRVKYGWDFVGDAFNADPTSPLYNPNPLPDPDPDDCNGHGTHVSGIVGANGTVRGVAPNVTFGAYRVFGCQGSTTSDIMIAAMERALADGMHVLNMSIGSAYQWPQYPTAQASNRLVNKGMVVVASIGNNGANGLYAAGAPGVGSKVIGTASFDNSHVNLAVFTVTPDGAQIGYANAASAPPAPLSGSLPMARTGTTTSTADACAALPAGSLAGKAALIRRGGCTFYVKSRNAQNAGAAAVVLYNNSPGRFSPTVAGTPPITIPVVAISGTEGGLIDGRIAAGAVTMTWTALTYTAPNPTGGLISDFSSYGLAPDLSLKPDIGAPGGLIRSTYPIELGSWTTISGTSMASPHVAGAAALLLEARPNTPSQAVDVIFQNSADPKPWWGNPALGFLDNVHRQGAGMLDIDDAILSTTKIEPSELSLGEVESGSVTRTLYVENKSGSAVTYDLSHTAGLATGPNTFTPSFFNAPSTVVFGAPSVTVPAGGTAMVSVTITPNASLADKSLFGGYIVFTPQGGGAIYRVPFAGFKGDYQSIAALTPMGVGLPWLAKLVGANLVNQPAGATYTLAGGDVPYIVFHLDHQVRLLRLEVFESGSGKAWHRAYEQEYVGRNSLATTFFAQPWDGATRGGNKLYTVPNGSYYIKLTVVKALGDPSNPAHVETWTSPTITINRP